jgi:alkaline phosphatase D
MGCETDQLVGRRRFLSTTTRAAGAMMLAPAVLRQESFRPSITYGTASGDVTGRRGIIWSRSDRPSRMHVDWSTVESFQNIQHARGGVARDESGFTARVDLSGLPPGQRIFYRVRFEDLTDSRNISLPAPGSFLAAPDAARDLSFAWGADVVGQGWGINPEWGGLKMFDTMRRSAPDFFIHCGDTIYADGPLAESVALPDGTIWKNVVTPAKSKVGETLDEFRGQHLYNMLDEHVRRFNAEVPQITLWDDHEVRNNWFPQQTIENDERYTIKSVAALSRNARRAFLEHVPIRLGQGDQPRIFRTIPYGPLLDVFALDLRTYRGPNTLNQQSARTAESQLAGSAQIEWLMHAVAASQATWKVVASDLPIGLIVRDGSNFEAVANGDGVPRGRELEIADLLRFLRHRNVRNVVWVTADVHYAAAHHYEPERARFQDFLPFWEFVAGPLHAGTGAPAALDDTFGPVVRFNGVPAGLKTYPGPSGGLQFFGRVRIAASTRRMTVELRNLAGDTVHSTDLDPER